MTAATDIRQDTAHKNLRSQLIGLARGFGAALIFALPILMTMELWAFGFTMDRLRLALMLVSSLPLLVGLAHFVGFEETFGWREDIRDALVALGIGMMASAVFLVCFGVIGFDASLDEVIGKIAVQTIPASIGALLGRTQLGGDDAAPSDESGAPAEDSYAGELFMMLVGALFLSVNVAPTEEMVLIAYMMTPWHALVLMALSLVLMHGFVYALGFKGGSSGGEAVRQAGGLSDFLKFTLVGYALCLAVCLYVLWLFGRLDAMAAMPIVMTVIVLAFPAAIGASAARLIL
jgi:putative integral membrane protein (TIGR02587 family)